LALCLIRIQWFAWRWAVHKYGFFLIFSKKSKIESNYLCLWRVLSKDDADSVSGYGFELTFRLRKAPEMNNSVHEIPLWPCKLMQYLAKYVFKTGTQFHAGHHVPFGHILPNLYSATGDTLIHDLMITNDRQLKPFRTHLGSVEFLQVQEKWKIWLKTRIVLFSLSVVLKRNSKQHKNVMLHKSLIYLVQIESKINEFFLSSDSSILTIFYFLGQADRY